MQWMQRLFYACGSKNAIKFEIDNEGFWYPEVDPNKCTKYIYMNPLISVIVPIYNAEEFLVQCIESILKQTYSDIQLVLVSVLVYLGVRPCQI
jgi:cellulose synthase/poly-beta-1,6-N-acetylglucosamine synthase-like glycosyltransferase